MARSMDSVTGLLTAGLPKLSTGARNFIREHPGEARMAVAVALETAAAQSEGVGSSGEQVPEPLRPFVVGGTREQILGVTEAAARLDVSRTTVYDWAERHRLIAWRSTKRGLNIPAAQIVGPGRVVSGLADVVEVVGDSELAWAFLSQEWPFEETVAQPLERLNAGQLDDVLSAAAAFGATHT